MRTTFYKQFGCVPVSSGILRSAVSNLRAPQAHIALCQRRGELIPLRRDLYLCVDENRDYSIGLIANHIFGPSYVSCETALAHHGFIPERVYAVKSCCLARSRTFTNSIGTFQYISIARSYYPHGVKSVRTEQGLYFLCASPEKALCDLVLSTPGVRIQSPAAAGQYLEQYLRIDEESRSRFDLTLLHEIALAAPKKKNDLLHIHRFLSHEYL